MKKAITHLKLNQANPGKLHKLNELAAEHQRVVQGYVDWLIQREVRQPNKCTDLPEEDVSTPLSDRWQRCGIVQSWYSNKRENRPLLGKRSLGNVCIQANPNVVGIEPSRSPHFDFWLRISTLESGHPVRIPIPLYDRAKETLTHFPKLCSGVTLNRRDGEWYATFVEERKGPKAKSSASKLATIVGVDISMNMLRKARTRFQEQGVNNVHLVKADAAHLPVDDATVNLVLSMNGWHAFADKQGTAAEMQRVLRHHGTLIACGYIKGARRLSDWFVRRFGVHNGFFTPPFFALDDMVRQFEGFTITRQGSDRSIAWFEALKEGA